MPAFDTKKRIHESLAEAEERINAANSKLNLVKSQLQSDIAELKQRVELYVKARRQRLQLQFVCKLCADAGKKRARHDPEERFTIQGCSHRICRKHARKAIRQQYKSLAFPLKCPVCKVAEITVEEAKTVLKPGQAQKLDEAFRRAAVFKCDLCPDGENEHNVDQLVQASQCQHRVCRDKMRQHLVTKSGEFAFPLMCPVCETSEITFQEAARVLTRDEMVSLEENCATSIERSFYFECVVCAEDKVPVEDLFSAQACGDKVCRTCAQNHVRTQYQAGRFPLTCPACDEELTLDEAETLLSVDEIVQLRQGAFDKAVADAVHCPQPDCPGVAEVVPPNTEFICPVCDYRMCASCREAWHADLTCEEVADRKRREVGEKAGDKAFEELARQENLQHCPTCHAIVEKINGCNHVVCRCRTGFCYRCAKLIPAANHGSQAVWGADGHACPLWS